MTWKSFKDEIDKLGILDSDEIGIAVHSIDNPMQWISFMEIKSTDVTVTRGGKSISIFPKE